MLRVNQAPSPVPTGIVAFADGLILEGYGLGSVGDAVGEVCFNTAITGYQEILSDPSYAAQIVTFTFPHIGNVGANDDDEENASLAAAEAARGAIFRAPVSSPSNYRARKDLSNWLKRRGIVAIADVDTRALTGLIREDGMPHAVIAHSPTGTFDRAGLVEKAKAWDGLNGKDLTPHVTTQNEFLNTDAAWNWEHGHQSNDALDGAPHVVVIDYGVKKNILRLLSSAGAKVTVLPAEASVEAIKSANPDGIVLSNGPGDPAATAMHATPKINDLINDGIPIFGICLGHQLLATALGGKTVKMRQGHHGANHPVKRHDDGRVEIVSMNHGFAVDPASLPDTVEPTFTSLFDGTNSGIRLKGKKVFSVQHHPEASPGPQDSFGLFKEFVDGLR
ncbi:MAG: glutamine-hydrolyzing carbamoyl-phosphate synthase small subunit [Pseudomonadota bacterium]